jgi:pyruvate dehydrogenase E1 component beta subunit
MFAHIPGLRVVVPSTPRDAYGLLLAAIRDPDPVVVLEPTRLYRLAKEEVADDGSAAALDRAILRLEGGDVTILAWGGMVVEALDAAAELARAGIAATVVDLPTLKPLDEPAILAAVARTGRCVIVQEAPLSGGVGAEIAARIAGRGLLSLVAPIERVAPPDVVVPLPRLEAQYRPDAARIVAAARRACAFA